MELNSDETDEAQLFLIRYLIFLANIFLAIFKYTFFSVGKMFITMIVFLTSIHYASVYTSHCQFSNDHSDCEREEIPKTVSVLHYVHKILTEFKKAYLEKKLIMLNGTEPNRSHAVRWCSERDDLLWLIYNLSILKKISATPGNEGNVIVKAEISELLFKEEFIRSV